ncbi:MAG: sulfurtransferase complex subunit TusB [Burkholderiales bacterium]|nr:sulfurtransferase complex subunit TusB [Burkholderiales bacterium]
MLHIVNKSPAQGSGLSSCLRLARPGQTVLLIEDAVLAATRANATASGLAGASVKVVALAPDLAARGLTGQLADGITTVDYAGFVALVAEHPTNQSWL